ncbi:Odorant receptor [Sergentomyia squamirostris]
MLQQNHNRLKRILFLFFKAWNFGFLPEPTFFILNALRLSIYPMYLLYGEFCILWHLFVQIEDYTDLIEVGFNVTFLIGNYQALMIYLGIAIYNKRRILEVFDFYEGLLEDQDVLVRELRRRHFGRSTRIAYFCAKYFLMATFVSFLFIVAYDLVRSNFVAVMLFYTPGFPRTSIWFYPVNLIHQFSLFFTAYEIIMFSDIVIMIMIAYCQAEMSVITELIGLLNNNDLARRDPRFVIRKILEVHLEISSQAKKMTAAFYHIYFHKLLAIMLYLGSIFLVFHSLDQDLSAAVLSAAVMMTQVFVLCYFGQMLTNSSQELLDAVYMTQWYEMTVRDQKDLLMLMMRLSRPVKVETFGFGDISIFTFVRICKASASYAAIIYTVLK